MGSSSYSAEGVRLLITAEGIAKSVLALKRILSENFYILFFRSCWLVVCESIIGLTVSFPWYIMYVFNEIGIGSCIRRVEAMLFVSRPCVAAVISTLRWELIVNNLLWLASDLWPEPKVYVIHWNEETKDTADSYLENNARTNILRIILDTDISQ